MVGIGRKMGMALRPLRRVMEGPPNLAIVSRWQVYLSAGTAYSVINTEQASATFNGDAPGSARGGFDIAVPTSLLATYTVRVTTSDAVFVQVSGNRGGQDILTRTFSAGTNTFQFMGAIGTTYIRFDKNGSSPTTVSAVFVG